ncbi:hypothetical protein FB45DRAFT_37904 [Roridomyces roridus]|uniref:Uncharacterized protein n=1 Tax=Roridomyces roridus TaxID=1738132 RepID=A0AAD7BR84_9AGAR|nr:hypothetical protein FB45DRAFT_37904 [Roridomyces roridus]
MDPHVATSAAMGPRWLRPPRHCAQCSSNSDTPYHVELSIMDCRRARSTMTFKSTPLTSSSSTSPPYPQEISLGQDISSSHPVRCAANVLLALPPCTGESLEDTCYTRARIDVLSRRCHPIWVNAAWSTRMLRDDAISESKTSNRWGGERVDARRVGRHRD